MEHEFSTFCQTGNTGILTARSAYTRKTCTIQKACIWEIKRNRQKKFRLMTVSGNMRFFSLPDAKTQCCTTMHNKSQWNTIDHIYNTATIHPNCTYLLFQYSDSRTNKYNELTGFTNRTRKANQTLPNYDKLLHMNLKNMRGGNNDCNDGGVANTRRSSAKIACACQYSEKIHQEGAIGSSASWGTAKSHTERTNALHQQKYDNRNRKIAAGINQRDSVASGQLMSDWKPTINAPSSRYLIIHPTRCYATNQVVLDELWVVARKVVPMSNIHWDWRCVEVNYLEMTQGPQGKISLSSKKIKLSQQPTYEILAVIVFEQDMPLPNGTTLPKYTAFGGTYRGCNSYEGGRFFHNIFLTIENANIECSPEHFAIMPIKTKQCFRCDIHRNEQEFIKITLGEGEACTHTEICKTCNQRTASKIKDYNSTARKNGGKGLLKAQQWLKKLHDSQGYCHYCNKFTGIPYLIIEHQNPLSLGGDNSIENVVPACVTCNSSKGDRDVATWKRHVEARNLSERLQEHLGLSKFEVTNLAIKKLAVELGLVDETGVAK